MARTDDDTWDLASSVGATATMVAAARAMASKADEPLIDDPYAEPLVRAVGIDVLSRLASGELTPDQLGGEAQTGIARLADNMAARTRFFDDFFLDATRSGITQAVILAAGLDARGYRLDWPAGTVVYEIDQPEVVAFKTRTLAELGAHPTAELRTVAIDLRYDWPAALKEAGFDSTLPTAWSAEGLLGYLPPDAQDRLLDTVTDLSAPGSRLATESAPVAAPGDEEAMRQRMTDIADHWREHGFDLDVASLVYFGDRNEADAYLADHGWQVEGTTLAEMFAELGLPPLDGGVTAEFAQMRYVVSTLPGGDR
jgi:methyltransferase (TIGR00027 family)